MPTSCLPLDGTHLAPDCFAGGRLRRRVFHKLLSQFATGTWLYEAEVPPVEILLHVEDKYDSHITSDKVAHTMDMPMQSLPMTTEQAAFTENNFRFFCLINACKSLASSAVNHFCKVGFLQCTCAVGSNLDSTNSPVISQYHHPIWRSNQTLCYRTLKYGGLNPFSLDSNFAYLGLKCA